MHQELLEKKKKIQEGMNEEVMKNQQTSMVMQDNLQSKQLALNNQTVNHVVTNQNQSQNPTVGQTEPQETQTNQDIGGQNG